MSDTETELQDVFREVFGDETIQLGNDMTADDIPGWDSLGHLNLIIAIEKRFGVRFATAEISRLKEDGQNVGSLVAMLAQKKPRLQ